MTTITMRPHMLRKLEALGFTFTVVLAVVLALALMATSSSIRDDVIITPGEYRIYELEGNPWSTVHFSIDSTEPVTVCITDDTGISLLKSGEGALCFFKAEGVTHIEKIWRFPKGGPLYLVVIGNSPEEPAEVSLRLSSGLVMWW
ncbi:hypothetical protein A3L11_08425 [Thermococcus siculi]|uniref:Uncharacterized protein n=1 Tax=Thermococcus siculi TaxID=72803 RepID=A0A2Z2MPD2_9EURY|nr:hypothetical protein [Thermococcus siculi]ASJ09251.1 hypothetical protein A3L11_08425 [Thermococcus siculi]